MGRGCDETIQQHIISIVEFLSSMDIRVRRVGGVDLVGEIFI